MELLISLEQLSQYKSLDKVPCRCYNCHNVFLVFKRNVTYGLNHINSNKAVTCSLKCAKEWQPKSRNKETQQFPCLNCKKLVSIQHSVFARSKTKNFFCCKSCAATYNNKNKTHGYRRSKFEIYVESCLVKTLTIDVLFNNKRTIGSELDIYVPSLKIAFEINGIFHYKPIYGETKLQQILNNDIDKKLKCDKLGIELFIIDISSMSKFSKVQAKPYFEQIMNIIKLKHATNDYLF